MLRDATELDLPRMLQLATLYSDEVVGNRYPIEADFAVASMADSLLYDSTYCKLLVKGGVVVGFLWATLTNFPWSRGLVAYDNIFYVEPVHRGGFGIVSLIRDYYKWATDKGAREVCISTASGIDIEKVCGLFEALDFKLIGYQFRR